MPPSSPDHRQNTIVLRDSNSTSAFAVSRTMDVPAVLSYAPTLVPYVRDPITCGSSRTAFAGGATSKCAPNTSHSSGTADPHLYAQTLYASGFCMLRMSVNSYLWVFTSRPKPPSSLIRYWAASSYAGLPCPAHRS